MGAALWEERRVLAASRGGGGRVKVAAPKPWQPPSAAVPRPSLNFAARAPDRPPSPTLTPAAAATGVVGAGAGREEPAGSVPATPTEMPVAMAGARQSRSSGAQEAAASAWPSGQMPPGAPPPSSWSRSRRTPILLVATLAAAFAGLLFLGMVFASRGGQTGAPAAEPTEEVAGAAAQGGPPPTAPAAEPTQAPPAAAPPE